MSKNNSPTYSYYFSHFGSKLYDFCDKERCMNNYIMYMFNRTQRIFEYKGLPDTIPARMLEFQLQMRGFACFAEVAGKLYAFDGGLGGEPDAYYRPTKCVVANPALKLSETYDIDKNCVIVRNDSFLFGLLPLFRRYATAMVENDISFRMASINTRIESLLSAPDDTTKSAAEKYLEDLAAGKIGVIASNEFLGGIKVQEVGRTMRTFTDLIEYQQYLKASWFNEIGLNANYNMKREKLSTTESQMNNDALLPLVEDMLENRRECLKQVNAMFGCNIEVDFASSWERLLEEIEMGEDSAVCEADSNQLDGEQAECSDESNQLDGGQYEDTADTGAECSDDSMETDDVSDVFGAEKSEEVCENVEVNVEVNIGGEENEEKDTSGSVPDTESNGLRDNKDD